MVGEDEVDDGDEGEVTLLGLTSTSFFSFRSTCLLFVPERKPKDHQCKMYIKRELINLHRTKMQHTQRLLFIKSDSLRVKYESVHLFKEVKTSPFCVD